MSEGKARAFYSSKRWIKCSRAYMQSQNYVCERCNGVAAICHHKVWLTPETVNDPTIALNWDLLECVCHDCHNKEHFTTPETRQGLMFDAEGNLKKQSPHIGDTLVR